MTARPPASGSLDGSKSEDFDNLLLEWRTNPTTEAAAELLSSGIVLGRFSEISEVATALAEDGSDVMPTLRSLARRVVDGKTGTAAVQEPVGKPGDTKSVRAVIAATRMRLRDWPRNPIAWVDLAYSYSVLGQAQQATRALNVALKLAPENRFVLRSAARHFADSNDIDRGLAALRRADLTKVDPWLLSAEIALANANSESPKLYKRAKALSESDSMEPWQTGELNAALGSLELYAASVGKARKYFKKSLRKPTENVVAQAQWASNEHKLLQVPLQIVYSSNAFEAIALRNRIDRRWSELIDACRSWALAEPTSVQPLVLGSYISEVALADGLIAGEFTELWINREPNNITALNNHAVALAYQGKIEEASRYFERINHAKIEGRAKVVFRATKGLLAYRRGEIDLGRKLYLEAAQSPEAGGITELIALVLWHLLREEARIATPGTSELSAFLWDRTRHIDLPEIGAIRETVNKSIARTKQVGANRASAIDHAGAVRHEIDGLLKPSPSSGDPNITLM